MEKRIMDKIDQRIRALTPELKELTLNIYHNPELGKEEVKACAWQVELLKKYGFTAQDHFCDIPTAYKAVYQGAKPGVKIAMLAEYDALPGLGHGCGHNLIAMTSVGAGLAIKELVDEFGGEIAVIGTPAEETEGAKVAMAKLGAFDEYDVAMMAHPDYEDIDSMNTVAIKGVSYEFFGKPAHAAAAPEKGVNALDAMINFYNMVNALRQQCTPDARIHGIITDGGKAPNVIPDYTSAYFNIRSHKMAATEELYERINACARGAALGTGCTVEIKKKDEDFMDTQSNHYLSELACDQMDALGHHMKRTNNMVLPGSSDVGDVSYRCPAIQLMMSMGPAEDGEAYSQHTEAFARQACTEVAMNNALDFARGFAMTAVELMTNPVHLQKIRAEFEAMER